MTPYALTPTTEQNRFNGLPVDSNNGVNGSRNGLSSTSEDVSESIHGSTTGLTNGHANGHANGHENGLANGIISHNGPSTSNGLVNSISNGNNNEPLHASVNESHDPISTPAVPYEIAYTNGYKEGYTEGYSKSHIELKHQPIAIVGMSCRFPGNVSTPDEFWELCARARTGFTEIPTERFDSKRFFHPNPGKSGTTNARGGNFLQSDLSAFDAPFFSFTAQEATSLDPQQRLLLECTFEALESAGIPKHSIIGKDVGCFVGGSFSEYEADLFRDPETIPMHQATGCAFAMQSNRLSHFFDLRGPSFTVDTACSSSLVALHVACQSIRNGESSTAIVGGVHLNMMPEFWISFSMSRLFGEAGRSYAFDQRGTGYGRGEGCGLLILKPLDQAIKDNDPIRAVITGSGINQDGKTPGITMPNGSAQESLIRSVYKNGGMNPADTGYVEAHGTGTRVGDPIEVSALHNVFGEGRNKRKPLFIGSVKSNIGHLEAAAGIAGVIKTALMLERGFILPNYDFKHPNEKIPFDEWGLKVPTTQRPWPLGKRWASINGFGFGGTNAHVVLTRGPLERKTMKEEIDVQTSCRLFVLSANDKTSTERLMQNMGVYLEQRPEVFQNDLLSNLAYTLGQRKSLLPWRVAIPASSSVELVETLSSGKVSPTRQELDGLRIGFIFTGQGAQWWAMGRELYEQYPVYASALDKADAHLTSIGAPFSLLEELGKDEKTSIVNAAHISQPSCTAIQLALVDLLRSWGIRPSDVAGHSSGEIGAAYAAGFINFENAMTIAYHRGRLVPILKERYPDLDGCMMAVGGSRDEIIPLVERVPVSMGEAKFACINSPSSVTMSGDATAIVELQRLIEEVHPGMFARKLQIDTAYHSHHMSLVAKDYTKSLLDLETAQASEVRFHSSLLGRLAIASEIEAAYWVQNLTCPVRFDEAVQSMCQSAGDPKTGVNLLLELGPHAALQGPIKQTLRAVGGAANKIAYASALQRRKDAVHTALTLASTLFVKGAMLEMSAINFPKPAVKAPAVLTDMPRYPWNHSSQFYHESRFTRIHKYQQEQRSDIIGALASYSTDLAPIWRNIIRLDDLPWLRHHQIQSLTIFPISGFVSMALEAVAQLATWKDLTYDLFEVRDVQITAPVMIPDEDLEMTTTLHPTGSGGDLTSSVSARFQICSWSTSKGWTEHCTGAVSVKTLDSNEVDGVRVTKVNQEELRSKISNITKAASQPIATTLMYNRLSEIGVCYGPSFQGLEVCHASREASTAFITRTDTAIDMPHHHESEYVLHPTFIEQAIEMYWPMLSTMGPLETVHLPSSIGKISISANIVKSVQSPGSRLQAFCTPSSELSNNQPNTLSIFAVSTEDQADSLISIENLVISPILEKEMQEESSAFRELCYKLVWEPVLNSPIAGSGEDVLDKQGLPTDATVEPEGIQKDVVSTVTEFAEDLVIIHGDTTLQHSLASGLFDSLKSVTGRSPAMGLLSAVKATGKICIFLYEIDQPLLATINATEFEALKELLTSCQGMLWVVRGAYANSKHPDRNMITGLSRTLRSEGTLMNFVALDLDAETQLAEADTVKLILELLCASLGAAKTTEETEFMERDGSLHTPRIIDDEEMNRYVHEQIEPPATEPVQFTEISRPLKASIATPGALDTLCFDDDAVHDTPLSDDQVEIHVKAIGMNGRDAEVAMGHIHSDSILGLECSGTVTSVGSGVSNVSVGDRVAAITTQGSLSTVARAHNPFLIKLPNHLSFQEAATIPIAYSTAYYSLIDLASLSEGESVLIHRAATAIGQAALVIAQMVGAEVYATVDSRDKKDTLVKEYDIPEERILYDSSEAFGTTISNATKGVGVDVILNTITEGELLRTTWSCLAKFGRFINIARPRGNDKTYLDKSALDKNPVIIAVDIALVAIERPRKMRQILGDVARLLRFGKIRAAHPINTYDISDATNALQAIHTNNEHGKVVVLPKEHELVLAPRSKTTIDLLRVDATYILIGGTGGLGRSMAKWMIAKGAKNIVLLSRSGTVKGKAKEQIDQLNSSGANILIRSCNVVDRADVDNLISKGLSDLPPVRGIVHGAMVLHDVLFEKMTYEQYVTVIESKVHGAWNFHQALEHTHLDFFIVISSAAGAVGNRGQAAYAAANTYLNGLAQYRAAKGLPAASIDLTAVSDAGYLAEDADKAAEVARNLGSDTICEAEVLALIAAAISGKMAVACNHHSITGMRITPTMQPFWTHDPKFVHLFKAAEEAAKASSSGKTVSISWSAALKSATSRAEAEEVVCHGLVDKISEVISMEKEDLDITRALSHYPLDSLTAIEIRNFITRMFEASFQVLELLASRSIQALATEVVKKSKVVAPTL